MIEKTLLYITQAQRRRSFKKWVFSDKEMCNAPKVKYFLVL